MFTKLRKIATIESVKGSNAIEGIGTTDERARGIVLHNTEPIGHDEKAIAGYRDALELIHDSDESLPFDEITVCGLYRTMFNHIGGGGLYKEVDNIIVDHTLEGNRIRWTPVSAADTEPNMSSLILAYREACDNPEIEPLILIPCVILDFLCIHPFSVAMGGCQDFSPTSSSIITASLSRDSYPSKPRSIPRRMHTTKHSPNPRRAGMRTRTITYLSSRVRRIQQYLSDSVPVQRCRCPAIQSPQLGDRDGWSIPYNLERALRSMFFAAFTSLSAVKPQKGHECTLVLRPFFTMLPHCEHS